MTTAEQLASLAEALTRLQGAARKGKQLEDGYLASARGHLWDAVSCAEDEEDEEAS